MKGIIGVSGVAGWFEGFRARGCVVYTVLMVS